MPRVQVVSSIATFITCSFVESVAYGVAAVLFVESVLSLLRTRRRPDRINVPLAVVAPLIFFFATLHVFGVWVRTYLGFVSYAGGPKAYWDLITTPEKTVTQVGQLGAITLADAMTVYRAWMIWERRLIVVAIPALTFIATLVSGVVFVTIQHQVNVHTSIFQASVTKWTEAWLASSLCTTGICTVLVVWKLAVAQRQLRSSYEQTHGWEVASSPKSLASRVIRIVVESAALYSVINLLYCVLYAAALNPEAWFSTLDAPVASITFSLIIIRTERAARSDTTTTATTRGPRSWNLRVDVISPGEKNPETSDRSRTVLDGSSSATVAHTLDSEERLGPRHEVPGLSLEMCVDK